MPLFEIIGMNETYTIRCFNNIIFAKFMWAFNFLEFCSNTSSDFGNWGILIAPIREPKKHNFSKMI